MLTLFTIPRSFAGGADIGQNNAIASWRRLPLPCEIILFGDDDGIAEAASKHGVKHIPHVIRTASGTPILDSVFSRANEIASQPLLCFVNADIILLDDFVTALQAVETRSRQFLMISSRFNTCIQNALTFDPNWQIALRQRVRSEGRMYPAGGSDIFAYRRNLFASIPPFAIGRGYWDNWLMYAAIKRGASLIDATDVVTAIHQDHDYSHARQVSGGGGIAELLTTQEAAANLEMAGGRAQLFTAYDATHILDRDLKLRTSSHPAFLWRPLKAGLRRLLSQISAARR